MRNILVIGDLHGLSVWKEKVNSPGLDKIIFLGDYVDSFTLSDSDIVKNLSDIIMYKKDNPDKVELLLGNHDIQYIYNGYNCSGRRESYAQALGVLYKRNLDLFKIMHQEGKYFFSHAGLCKGWVDTNRGVLNNYGSTYVDSINAMFESEEGRHILMQVSRSRGGRDHFSGPLWADKKDTMNYVPSINMHQIVGHTPVNYMESYPYITYCDNLEHGDGVTIILTTS